jgi:brefeldin A-resistance guanine nucleotide exchange factor 1
MPTPQNEAGESLKNVILVMHSSGLLLPPPATTTATATGGAAAEDTRSEEQKNLWASTAGRIERILPGFLAEALPAERGASGAGAKAGDKPAATGPVTPKTSLDRERKVPGS